MKVHSKLPNTGNSIFSVMSKLATEHQALNLSQGFPDFECDPELVDLVTKYMKQGKNQYPPMPGVQELREVIADQTNRRHGCRIHPDKNINITSGATQAIYTAITSVVRRDDEVVIFTPAYDCYKPAIELNGGKIIAVPLLAPDFKIDFQRLKDVLSAKTRMIIVNTPHNPSGSLIDRKDWQQLAELVADTDVIILSDEVYEHIVFDENRHCSVLAIEDLRNRAFAVSSFGKTFHVTGWKMGYCVAAEELMTEFRKCHQSMVFTSHSPTQYALAEYMRNEAKITGLSAFYQQKRDLFLQNLGETSFEYKPAKGTYFQLLNYNQITREHDVDFARKLTIDKKLASIPVSVFFEDERDDHYLRFCFAKGDETLKRAGEILNQIGNP